MDTKELLMEALKNAAAQAVKDGVFPEGEMPEVTLEVPPKAEFGDFATNFAMKSAKVFHMNPRKIAEAIIERLQGDWLEKAEIAGPGFINIYFKSNVIYDNLLAIYKQGEEFGNLPKKDHPRIQVEYVSANPTGLLHVGHGRNAAVGSALVNLFKAAGYPTSAEYYINDAGNQINNLGLSVNYRYLELLGKAPGEFPEDGYHGADIIDTAKHIVEEAGEKYLDMPEEERIDFFKEYALKEKLEIIKQDLKRFNVDFDVWFSERTLYPDAVDKANAVLIKNGNLYEKDGALWLRSTKYGDDKDRVVIRSNGVPTYFASDIAYHHNKFSRGFDHLIDIWGADHHGYVARVKGSMAALGYNPDNFEVVLLQMISLFRGGEQVKMSKRSGTSVTLQELMDEVGTDVARYFFVMRSPDSQLDFDLDLAKKRSSENPVYYIQYANARANSIFRQAKESGTEIPAEPKFSLLTDETELRLIKKMLEYPAVIAKAAEERAPQHIARYAYELAGDFHSFYNKCRIIGVEKDLAQARLGLVKVAAHTIRHSLAIIGVSAPEKM